MGETLIAVARIASPHGVRGEVKLLPLTDFPHRFEDTDFLYLADGTGLVLEAARLQKDMVLAKFRGMDTPEAWLPLRNKELYVPEDALMPLPEGQYYIHQLLGMQAVAEDGAVLGEVADILQTGSNDVYVVRQAGGTDLLLPAIDTVILRIEPAERRMTVRPPEYW